MTRADVTAAQVSEAPANSHTAMALGHAHTAPADLRRVEGTDHCASWVGNTKKNPRTHETKAGFTALYLDEHILQSTSEK